MTKSSWWSLKIEDYPNYKPNDVDLEHIAECIKQGYDNGQLIQEEDQEDEQKTRASNGPPLPEPCAMARGSGTELQATSRKLQASGCKLDKIKLQCYSIL